jgi:hypothetical protein
MASNADAAASSDSTEADTAEATEDSNSEGNDSKETTETSEEPPAPEASTEQSGQPEEKKKAKGYVMAKGRALIIGGRNYSEGMPITAKNCKDKKEFDKFVKGGYIVKA